MNETRLTATCRRSQKERRTLILRTFRRCTGILHGRAFLLIALLIVACSCCADELDDYIRARMKACNVPAVVFGVFKDGKILRSGAYGQANVELKAPATIDTVFEIGSVTKQFTATLVLMLKEENRLKLDGHIDSYLENLPQAWREVTIRQLLNHTGGIPDIEEIFGYDSYRNIYSYDQIIAIANSKSMDFSPGTKFHYSNTGYFLLGHILQKIEGKPYETVLQERIFKPLDMTHTQESNPADVIENRCAGYQLTKQGLRNRDAMQPSACLAAGTIVSTIGDMAKWDAAITQHRLLKSETQELMWQPTQLSDGQRADYGFGWFIDDWRGHPCVEHSGGTAGFSCDYRRFQDLGLSVVVFCNLYSGTDTGLGDIETRAIDAVHPGLSYVSRKPIPDDPKTHDMFLKAMEDVAKGGAGSPCLSDAMWKSYSDQSRQEWKSRLAYLESFELLEHTKYAPIKSAHDELAVETYAYRLKTGGKTLFIIFKLDSNGKIIFQQRVDS